MTFIYVISYGSICIALHPNELTFSLWDTHNFMNMHPQPLCCVVLYIVPCLSRTHSFYPCVVPHARSFSCNLSYFCFTSTFFPLALSYFCCCYASLFWLPVSLAFMMICIHILWVWLGTQISSFVFINSSLFLSCAWNVLNLPFYWTESHCFLYSNRGIDEHANLCVCALLY